MDNLILLKKDQLGKKKKMNLCENSDFGVFGAFLTRTMKKKKNFFIHWTRVFKLGTPNKHKK
jgi:hypothetical protein